MMEHPWVDLHMSQCAPGPAACAVVGLCVVRKGAGRWLCQESQAKRSSAASGALLQPALTGPVLLRGLHAWNSCWRKCGVRRGILCTQGNVLFLQDHKQNPGRVERDPAALGRAHTAGATSFMEHFPGVK